jgi:hypothetical protein
MTRLIKVSLVHSGFGESRIGRKDDWPPINADKTTHGRVPSVWETPFSERDTVYSCACSRYATTVWLLASSIDRSPCADTLPIQFDLYDPQLRLLSESSVAAPGNSATFVSLALADVNGNGKPDLVALSLGSSPEDRESLLNVGSLWILLGNGDDAFQPRSENRHGNTINKRLTFHFMVFSCHVQLVSRSIETTDWPWPRCEHPICATNWNKA